MSARRRLRGVELGRVMFDASRGDREARAALDALAEERTAQQTDDTPAEQPPRGPKPEPTQGVHGTSVRTTGTDVGRGDVARARAHVQLRKARGR